MNPFFFRGAGLLAAVLAGTIALTCANPCSAKAVPQNNKNKPVPTTPDVAITYSGRGTALFIDDVQVPIPGPIVLADTGALAAAGGTLEASESNYQLLGSDGVTVALGVELAYATTAGNGPEATGDANLTTFEVRMDTPANGRLTVTADYVGASASAAVATNGSVQTEGSVSVENLLINGVAVTVTGAVNQTLVVPGGTIVFNEQTTATVGGRTEITVVAMHIYINGCMNGAFGRVTAGIAAGSTPPTDDHDCGKLTGGGWIVGPSGAKATFGISGGIRRGEFWGHLNYIDHGTGLQVKSTRVTNYIPNPNVPDCRIISYDVEINGLPGTAVVDAWDRGEPGRNDFFSIKLSTGYSARGTLGGDGPGGGNLQLHKCPPGWDK
jgi:hypothetical protein